MATTVLYASSHVTGNVSTPNNAVGSTSGTWTSDVDNTSWTSRWEMAMPTYPDTSIGQQTVTFRVRKQTGTGNPTVTITLFENNSSVSTLTSNYSVTSSTGEDIVLNWTPVDQSLVVSFQLAVTAVGGSPSSRATVQLDYIQWDCTYTSFLGSDFQAWTGSWVHGKLKIWNGSQWAPALARRWNGSSWVDIL